MITQTRHQPVKQTEDTSIVSSRSAPMTSQEFLERFGDKDEVELVDGVVTKRMAAQWKHERLFQWLIRLIGDYVETLDLGIAFGSRSAVLINSYRTRLPDMVFIRKERMQIISDKAIQGTPDWVMEIRSLGDRDSDLMALESDYRALQVPEIWFIDQPNKRVRALRLKEDVYEVEELGSGRLHSHVSEGFWLDLEWIFADEYPKAIDILKQLLQE
ncbi:MAG: Uma2 family endonuclease [Fimbriimonadia bacterium]|nr:Uma2 family endonuclease [Fimbriimonadia bacterium]